MSHRNARLTFHGRLLLVERIQDGQPVSHVAKAAGVSRQSDPFATSAQSKRSPREGTGIRQTKPTTLSYAGSSRHARIDEHPIHQRNSVGGDASSGMEVADLEFSAGKFAD
jgi:hypothetical protein